MIGLIDDRLADMHGGFVDVGMTETSTRFVVAISAKRDDPDAWFAAQEADSNAITLSIGDARLPYFATGQTVQIDRVLAVLTDTAPTGSTTIAFDGGASPPAFGTFATWPPNSPATTAKLGTTSASLAKTWPDEVTFTGTFGSGLSLADAGDLIVVFEVSVV